jgi:hypothetical protein
MLPSPVPAEFSLCVKRGRNHDDERPPQKCHLPASRMGCSGNFTGVPHRAAWLRVAWPPGAPPQRQPSAHYVLRSSNEGDPPPLSFALILCRSPRTGGPPRSFRSYCMQPYLSPSPVNTTFFCDCDTALVVPLLELLHFCTIEHRSQPRPSQRFDSPSCCLALPKHCTPPSRGAGGSQSRRKTYSVTTSSLNTISAS